MTLFDDISFRGSQIFEVREDVFNQSLELILDFPADEKAIKFEKKILRFKAVLVQIKKETPSLGFPKIVDIKLTNIASPTHHSSASEVSPSPFRMEMTTTAGTRLIEFSEAELVPLSH